MAEGAPSRVLHGWWFDRGIPAAHASVVLGATAAMGVVGKLGFGALLDRFEQGGNATLVASLTGAVFGRLHYGAISGRMTPFLVASQAVGVPMAGLVRDRTGSFAPVLVAAAMGSLVAAAIVLRVRVPGGVNGSTPVSPR